MYVYEDAESTSIVAASANTDRPSRRHHGVEEGCGAWYLDGVLEPCKCEPHVSCGTVDKTVVWRDWEMDRRCEVYSGIGTIEEGLCETYECVSLWKQGE